MNCIHGIPLYDEHAHVRDRNPRDRNCNQRSYSLVIHDVHSIANYTRILNMTTDKSSKLWV